MDYNFEFVRALYRGAMIEVPTPLVNLNIDYNGVLASHYFLIDTGSTGSHINTKGLDVVKSAFVIPKDNSHIELKPFLPFNDELVRFFVNRLSNLTNQDDHPNQVGLIGTNILKDYLLTIDYQNKKIFFEKDCKVRDGLFRMDANFSDSYFVFFDINYDGKKLKLLFDTGCGGDLILFEHRVDIPYLTSKSDKSRGANGVTYETIEFDSEISLTDSYKTKIKILKTHTTTKDFDFDGILGNNILFDNKICIDYPNRAFYTDRPCGLIQN